MRFFVYIKLKRDEGPISWDGQQLVFAVNAAPKDGEANKRLIHLLSRWTSTPKTSITIAKGAASRHKTIDTILTTQQFDDLLKSVPRAKIQGDLFD